MASNMPNRLGSILFATGDEMLKSVDNHNFPGRRGSAMDPYLLITEFRCYSTGAKDCEHRADLDTQGEWVHSPEWVRAGSLSNN